MQSLADVEVRAKVVVYSFSKRPAGPRGDFFVSDFVAMWRGLLHGPVLVEHIHILFLAAAVHPVTTNDTLPLLSQV
jgi:hypothetical protein